MRAAPFLHACGMIPSVQEVLRRLESEDPLQLGEDAASVHWQARCLEQRRYSSIWFVEPALGRERVHARAGLDELVLKLYRSPQPERRRKEFEDLRRAHEALAPDSGVVRPVACWPEHGALLTERARGVPLAAVLRRASRRGVDPAQLAQAAALCTTAGTWLRRFQARGAEVVAGSRPDRLGSAAGMLDYIDERLRLLRTSSPGIDPALRTRLLAHAAATLHALPPDSLDQVTWSHSDFGPHNLLADLDHLTVLDLELQPQHPYFDAAYFVECLANLNGPLADASRIRRLERAFLAGWGQHLDEPLFALFRLRHLVCSYVSESRRSGLARLRQWPGLLGMRARLRLFPQRLPLRAENRAA